MSKQRKVRAALNFWLAAHDPLINEGSFTPAETLDSLLKCLDEIGLVIRGQSLGASHPHLADYYTVEPLIGA